MLPGLFNAWNLRPNAPASLSNSNESKHESEQKGSMPDTNKSIIKLKLPKWLPGEQALWFSICERKMKLGGLASTTSDYQEKMSHSFSASYHMMSSSQSRSTSHPLYTHIPNKHEYDDLKEVILSKHQESPRRYMSGSWR